MTPYSSLFYTTLAGYHLFPLHMPLTLFLMDAPFGRFASGKETMWDLDGNIAWFLMEIVSPVTFLTTIVKSSSSLSTGTHLAITMYLIHYSVRAIISPLILAPKRSKQNIIVTLSSITFNLVNGYLMGSYLARDPMRGIPPFSVRMLLGSLGWAIGLLGNIYHDEILHDLRRPSVLLSALGQSRYQAPSADSKDKDAKYKIPKGGLFGLVAFPNYLSEWFEWTCYALMVSPTPILRIPSHYAPFITLLRSTRMPIPYPLLSLLSTIPTPGSLLNPPWMFVLAEVTSMLPRAIRGGRWYRNTFGKEWDASGREGGRWVVVPGVI